MGRTGDDHIRVRQRVRAIAAALLLAATGVAGGGLVLHGTGAAQEPKSGPSAMACFDVVSPSAYSLPKSPILVNKCTGQTYLLVRRPGPKRPQLYDWAPIIIKDSEPTTVARRRCFTYEGREFCP